MEKLQGTKTQKQQSRVENRGGGVPQPTMQQEKRLHLLVVMYSKKILEAKQAV